MTRAVSVTLKTIIDKKIKAIHQSGDLTTFIVSNTGGGSKYQVLGICTVYSTIVKCTGEKWRTETVQLNHVSNWQVSLHAGNIAWAWQGSRVDIVKTGNTHTLPHTSHLTASSAFSSTEKEDDEFPFYPTQLWLSYPELQVQLRRTPVSRSARLDGFATLPEVYFVLLLILFRHGSA